jgi:hypothetical protein
MALQVALSAADSLVGFDFPMSYAKIEFVRGWKNDSLIWVNWYADKAARESGSQPVRQKEFSRPGDTAPFVDYYDFLKTQPEFAGAIDV